MILYTSFDDNDNYIYTSFDDNDTVEQDISADTLFSRLGDFAVSRILIFADAGTEHSTSTLLFYCRNEKTAVSISLVIDYKSNSCIPFRNTGEVLKSLLCVVCVLKVHATSSSDTARHTVLVERWINSSSSDRCLILKMNSLFYDFSDFFKSRSFIFADWRSTAKITCPRKYPVLQ